MANKTTLGVLTVIFGILLFNGMDVCAKWLTDYLPANQIAFLRNVVSLPIVVALVLSELRRRAKAENRAIRVADLTLRQWRLALFRGLLMAAAQLSFFASVGHLPLATVATIAYIAPALITALSVFILAEKVGPYRWGAVAIGFLGVLIIQRPFDPSGFTTWTLLPLVTAFCYALILVLLRTFDDDAPSALLTLYAAVMATMVNTGMLVFGTNAIPTEIWPVIITMGVFGGLGHYILTLGFRMAPASVIAPFEYVGLLFAFIAGWVFFNEVPDSLVWFGSALILSAGLVIILRERRKVL